MKNIKNNTVFWCIVLFMMLLGGIIFGPISGDAPYYLAVARDISNGLVPYRDVNVGYTPLVMYFNAVLYAIFNQPPYFVFIIFQYVVIFLGAWLLYKVSLQLNLERRKAIFLSVFYFICVLSSDGSYINLEVYSVFFVLLAYLMYLRQNYLIAGMVLGLSFFCKQYGILNFVPFGLLILISGSGLKNLFRFAVGGLIPLLLFLTYYCVLEGIALEELLFKLSGQSYGERSIAQSKSILGFFIGAKIFILMLVPLLFLKFNPLQNRTNQILTVGIVLVLLPVLVQYFQHYFIHAFPYVAILIAMQWRDREINWLSMHLPLLVISALLILRIVNYREKAVTQKAIAVDLTEWYPKGSVVFLKSKINYLYLLNDYKNPALKDGGYGYSYQPSSDFIEAHTVLALDKIPGFVPVRIVTVQGQKIYEY